jgi:hypothetical protein
VPLQGPSARRLRRMMLLARVRQLWIAAAWQAGEAAAAARRAGASVAEWHPGGGAVADSRWGAQTTQQPTPPFPA